MEGVRWEQEQPHREQNLLSCRARMLLGCVDPPAVPAQGAAAPAADVGTGVSQAHRSTAPGTNPAELPPLALGAERSCAHQPSPGLCGGK